MLTERQLEILRQRAGLEKNDTSLDDELKAMPPIDKFKDLVAWNFGHPDWANEILYWAECAGFKVTE